ncbi:MAG TPA: hypothetical protein VGP07_25505 [Polyangia bacterium]
MADPILKNYGAQALMHFERAASSLALRQVGGGGAGAPPGSLLKGNVGPWPGSTDADFHGTLASIWVWARHQSLSEQRRFAPHRAAGWSFIQKVWRSFVPEAIGPAASDEAAYDCAMVLRAAVAELPLEGGGGDDARSELVAGAARVLAAHLGELEDLSGRDFQDPGFLAWNLIEYARAVEDRGLLAAGRRFVERAFGMKAPPVFATEPETAGTLFDFSSTTAMRVLAIVASEGNTPFVGAWLRERVARAIPPGFVKRGRDETCWNGSVAALLGRAYVISTEARFLDAYRAIRAELERRTGQSEAARSAGDMTDTLVTFYTSLGADALVRTSVVETSARGANVRR